MNFEGGSQWVGEADRAALLALASTERRRKLAAEARALHRAVPAGGATDISARLLGEKLTQIWGQQVVIENRGGAGGGVGAAEAARARPTATRCSSLGLGGHREPAHLRQAELRPGEGFRCRHQRRVGPAGASRAASSPYKTVKRSIDAAKGAAGQSSPLATRALARRRTSRPENFVNTAKIDAVQVPYKGEGPCARGPRGRRHDLCSYQRRRCDAAPSNGGQICAALA
jgi:tripartite-type tricarboxylate transporter receptor subunit TctC